jgi:hypothetical protein
MSASVRLTMPAKVPPQRMALNRLSDGLLVRTGRTMEIVCSAYASSRAGIRPMARAVRSQAKHDGVAAMPTMTQTQPSFLARRGSFSRMVTMKVALMA